MSVEADLPISSEASPRSAPQPAPVRWWVVGLVGVTGFLVGVWGSWIPPIWDDEGATILSATRSWESLARLVQSIDLVHAAYYSIMHVWFGWVGYSPFTLRLPSAFAVGAAAALMVVLVGRLASARVAVFAGLVLAVLPRATWAAVEGRSYAITLLLAVVMTLLFVVALDGATDTTRSVGNAVRWGAYAIVCVVAVVLFVYLALLVIAHGVAVLTLVILRRVGRRGVIGFALAAVAAAASTLPLVVALGREVGQVSWILPLSRETVGSVLVTQFYVNDRIVAAVATALIVVGAVILVRRRGGPAGGEAVRYLALFLPILVVPTALILVVSLLGKPLYLDRYLTFCLPAVAALIAVVLGAVRLRWGIVGFLALTALATPGYLAQRTPLAHGASPWHAVAERIGSDTAGGTGTGTGVAFELDRGHGGIGLAAIAVAYPEYFTEVRDVTLVTDAEHSAGIWPVSDPVTTGDLTGLDTLWLVAADADQLGRDGAVITSGGFVEISHETLGYLELIRYERRT